MRKAETFFRIVFFQTVFSLLIGCAFDKGSESFQEHQEQSEDYRIAPGDVISILVFGEDDLSLNNINVAHNGTISFPLLGEVDVQDLTTGQIEQRFEKLLSNGYLKNPRITVSVQQYRLFYIVGEVNSPGGYSYRHGLTVQKAIALAGDLTHRASLDKITPSLSRCHFFLFLCRKESSS